MFCNGQDACLQGVCAHAGDPCATGGSCNVCSEATASCEVPAGSACPPDDDPCTTDFCNDSGFCTHTRVVDVPCDDGDPCTDVDTCRVNGCAGTPRTCTAADACHAAGTCDPQTGVCSTSALADGTPCPDLLFCNGPDTCSAGTCLHAGDPCRVSTECNNVCDEVHDACLTPLGTPCGPGSSQPCHTTECDGAGRCVTVLENDVACDDGDRCTRNDQCTSGSCHGVPNTCAGDACHESGTCNPTTGQCVAPAKPDGTPCTSDTRLCTVDACVGGDCRHTPDDTRCDDHTCTDGACRPDAPGADTRGCVSVPAREGDICTDDGVGCTDDRCRAGTCTHLPNDANCDNTDECGSTLCAPERGDARGCAPALDRATTDTCSEDADACSDDRCDSGRCTHVQVTPYVTCQSVQAPWDLARNLARAARTLQVGVRGAGATVDPQLAAINTELESTAGALEEASGMLSGRLPPAHHR